MTEGPVDRRNRSRVGGQC